MRTPKYGCVLCIFLQTIVMLLPTEEWPDGTGLYARVLVTVWAGGMCCQSLLPMVCFSTEGTDPKDAWEKGISVGVVSN